VEGFQGPRQTGENEVPQLPPPKLAAILLQHLVDAELLRRSSGALLLRPNERRGALIFGISGRLGGHLEVSPSS